MLAKIRYAGNAYELPDTIDLYFSERWSWLLKALGTVWHFGILFPLAAAGLYLAWKPRLWILPALALSLAASVAIFFVVARYRLPAIPVLIVLAAAGVTRAWNVKAVAIAAAVAIFANWPGYPRTPKDAMMLFNWGVVLDQEGRRDDAILRYREAFQLTPSLAEAQYNLGNALRKSGRLREAQAALEAAVNARPDYSEAWNNLGLVLREEGDLHGAAKAIFRSLEQSPANLAARRNLEQLRETAQKQGDLALSAEIAKRL